MLLMYSARNAANIDFNRNYSHHFHEVFWKGNVLASCEAKEAKTSHYICQMFVCVCVCNGVLRGGGQNLFVFFVFNESTDIQLRFAIEETEIISGLITAISLCVCVFLCMCVCACTCTQMLVLCTQEGSLLNGASHLHKSLHQVNFHHSPFSFMKVEDLETMPEHFASSGFHFYWHLLCLLHQWVLILFQGAVFAIILFVLQLNGIINQHTVCFGSPMVDLLPYHKWNLPSPCKI